MTISPLWIAPSYPCEVGDYGGIWLQTQAHALKAIGMRPLIVAPVPWVPPGVSAITPQWERYARVPLTYDDAGIQVFRPHYFSHPQENKIGAPQLMQFLRLRFSALKRPSLVHAHFALPQGWVAMKLARHWDVPLVVSLLGDDVNIYPHFRAGDMKRFREIISSADAVISQGSALNDATEAMTGRRPKTLPLGIKIEKFSKRSSLEQSRSKLGLPQGRPISFFAGNLLDSKGVPELLCVLERLADKNILGVFAGDGPLRSLIDATPNAVALGSLDQDKMRDYLEAVDMVVLPSHREGLPLCLVEAGAMELPVVASDVGSIRDLLDEDRGWLIPPKDETALAIAMRAVLDQPEEAAKRAAKLFRHVHDHFSDTGNAMAIADIYRSLVRENI